MPGLVLSDLHDLWLQRGRSDEYIGTLVNTYLERGGSAWGVPAGRAYVDVGTLDGYRQALRLLEDNCAKERRVRPLALGRLG